MSLFERSGMSVAILDLQLRVLETNTAFFQQFGRLSTDVRGHGFCEFLHPSVRQHMLRQFARLTMGGRARLTERVVAIRPDGTTFAGELTGLAVPGDSAQIKTVVVLMRAERSKNDNPVIVDPYRTLTDLDAKILEGVAAGIPTVQLATKLYLSRQGVEYHVSAMLRKFKVPNRAALVAKAYAVGIFSVDCWPPAALPEYVK
ncbi:helix-turn-helix transcriptional regulator [Actinocrispum wychmicini]|nr:LuxR C-terminal-related transcriptional regulator [Actinocrispum wychmicini]